MIADMDPPTNSSGLGINFCLNLFGVDFKIKNPKDVSIKRLVIELARDKNWHDNVFVVKCSLISVNCVSKFTVLSIKAGAADDL